MARLGATNEREGLRELLSVWDAAPARFRESGWCEEDCVAFCNNKYRLLDLFAACAARSAELLGIAQRATGLSGAELAEGLQRFWTWRAAQPPRAQGAAASPVQGPLRFVEFNREGTLLALGYDAQVLVVCPLDSRRPRFIVPAPPVPTARWTCAALLGCTNLVFLGARCDPFDGDDTKTPLHHMLVWDDATRRFAGAAAYASRILRLRVSRTHLLVATERASFVYVLTTLALTKLLPPGPCDLADWASATVVCAGAEPGALRSELASKNASLQTWSAHRAALVHAVLFVGAAGGAQSAELIASCSTSGRQVRLWSAEGKLMRELHRGACDATVFSISIHMHFVAVTSSRGTLHVYDLRRAGSASTAQTYGLGPDPHFVAFDTRCLTSPFEMTVISISELRRATFDPDRAALTLTPLRFG